MTVGRFWSLVDIICKRHNCSVTSGFRTIERNKVVGGSEYSRHTYGLAADIVPDDWNDKEQIIKDCKRLGIVAVDEQFTPSPHIHVQDSPAS